MHVYESNGTQFYASQKMVDALNVLAETRKGGFASVKGYVSTTGYVTPQTADFNVMTRFSTERLYARKAAALEVVTLADIGDAVANNPKLSALTPEALQEAFEARKASEIASLNKTLEGDRSDAQRAAHDRNYLTIDTGIKVHFRTEKNTDGIMVPVLMDGLPIADSIMVAAIEVARKVIVEGTYKVVNSGVPVLIGNAIAAKLPKSTKIKYLSLKSDNFESITVDTVTIASDDI